MIYLSNEWINRSNEKEKDNSKDLEKFYSDINISGITEKNVELENSDGKITTKMKKKILIFLQKYIWWKKKQKK